MIRRIIWGTLALLLAAAPVHAANVGDIDAGTMLGRLTGAGKGPPRQVPMAASSLTDGNTGTGAIVHAISPTLTGTITGENLTLSGTLNADGAATLGGTLGVTGAATFSSTVGITGNTTIGGTLGVTGNTTIGGTLGVTGAATLSSTAAITGNTTVGGTLGVTGDATFAANIFAAGGQIDALSIVGNLGVGGQLDVTGVSSFAATTTFGAQINIGDTNFYIKLDGVSNPTFNFEPTTYLVFDRAVNALSLVVGASTKWTVSAGGNIVIPGCLSHSGGTIVGVCL